MNTNVVYLDANLSHATAEKLLGAIRENDGKSLTIDGGAVEHLGAQCMQILLSAANSWGAAGLNFAVVNRSVSFNESLHRFGFLPSDIPGEENLQ